MVRIQNNLEEMIFQNSENITRQRHGNQGALKSMIKNLKKNAELITTSPTTKIAKTLKRI